VLSLAAVIGRDFEVDVLARVAEAGEEQLLDLLDAGSRAALIVETEGPRPTYRFVHALIQQTLYADLSAARRQRAHQRVAEALEALAGQTGRVAELAHHWLSAGGPANIKALRYARLAGDAARVALAPVDAIAWYDQALELLGQQPTPDRRERCELLTGLADAQRTAGLPEHRASKLEAGALARELGDPDLLVSVALSQTFEAWQTSQSPPDPEWLAVLEAALGAAGSEDSPTRARLLAAMVDALDPRDWRRRATLCEEALAVARRVADNATALLGLTTVYVNYGPDALERRLAESAEAVALSNLVGDPVSAFSARRIRLIVCAEACDLVEVDRMQAELDAIAEQTRLPPLEFSQAIYRCWRHVLAGRLDEAEAVASRTLELGHRMAHPTTGAVYATQLAQIRRHQGRSAEIADLFARATAEHPAIAVLRSGLPGVDRYRGGTDEAALLAHDVATGFEDYPYDITWLTAMVNCAATAVRLRHIEAAKILYERLTPFRHHLAFVVAVDQGVVARPLARLAMMLGRDDEAEDHLRLALDIHQRIQAVFWIARTQLDYAELLLRRNRAGDVQRAQEFIRAADESAEAHGYGGLQRRASTLLGAS
jgi:tetratricopeptide (TPR) repeat protein